MRTKLLELNHLTPYLPYGLKAEMLNYKSDYVGKQYDEIIGLHEWSKNKDWCCLTGGGSKPSLDDIKPILRPLSQLITEIEHNGEKFVPMVELAKVARLDVTKYVLGSVDDAFGIRCNIENDVDDNTHEILGFDNTNGFGHHYKPSRKFTMVVNQIELWQKLHKWKFDIFSLIENKLAIAVTDEFNPYE
jgi:hypothetical protein